MSLFTSHPDLSFLLVLLGSLGICAEFLRPGAILPGVIGSALALVGLAGISPLDWRGAALVIAAFPFFGAGMRFSVRAFTAVGAILMAGGVMTMQPRIHFAAAMLTIPVALLVSFLLSVAVRARSNKAIL